MANKENIELKVVKVAPPPQLTPFKVGGVQPTSQAKKDGWQRRRELKDSAQFFLNLPSRKLTYGGVEYELNSQDEIAKKLIELAQKGNLKAVELLTKIMPNWSAVQKTENINMDIPFKVVTEFKDFRTDFNEKKLE
ncbi:MAG: hypothetical protein IPM06_22255 [Rhizobiales bacterium]|nr:hypothetical protein [Hyphomicrobiales bacterium]